ncbi:uncharacterized protein BDR25DRAFT_305533 [Lindgomyces ingoldianus]|uniref:Uncharacterized protein n=1 Tax=Lindgomyces ingoldianus TaxID=673940 RepID=A0ACB6QKJ5_9PLEO|nr:uncharacterized protein BDR25DRAFT_305533 [Lindgomyces ingoldianus]KAF2467484.1 hypothetical protein BDR25DRAFT_305533 [Lindgomyces ingoldianus]
MPSSTELARRLQRLQDQYRQASAGYQNVFAQHQTAHNQVTTARRNLEAEERVGQSQARARIRQKLLQQLQQAEVNERSLRSQVQRANATLRRREGDLQEEIRYIEETATLQRRPIPRELAEMISAYNYRGRYQNDPDA